VTVSESIVMTVFHGLHHYKMNLCEKCIKQVLSCCSHSSMTRFIVVIAEEIINDPVLLNTL